MFKYVKEEKILENNEAVNDGRDPKTGRFIEGWRGNPVATGRPSETAESRAKKKVLKELVVAYKESLAEILPQLSPILIAKAISGDMQAIKEIHAVVVGEAPKDLNFSGEVTLPIIYEIRKLDDSREKNN